MNDLDTETLRQQDKAAAAMAALANRWRKRLDTLRRQRAVPVGLADLDTLAAEDDDRQRLRRERARLEPAMEGGVLVRPAGGAGWAMRGRCERQSRTRRAAEPVRRRYRTDWPGDRR